MHTALACKGATRSEGRDGLAKERDDVLALSAVKVESWTVRERTAAV